MSPLDQLCLFLLCLVLVARAFCEQLPPRSPALLRAPEEPPPASEQRAEGSRGGARGAAALIGQHLLSPPRGGSWEESSKVFFFLFFFLKPLGAKHRHRCYWARGFRRHQRPSSVGGLVLGASAHSLRETP